jgi:uncharacterized protein (TIGR00255 family)
MTGFGATEKEGAGVRVACQIRTVNHRFFEWKPKIPSLYYAIEERLKSHIQKVVQRGVVDLSIRRWDVTRESQSSNIDGERAKTVAHDLAALAEKLKMDVSTNHLFDWVLRFPDVIQKEVEKSEIPEAEVKLVEEAVDDALKKVEAFRKREGKHLKSHCEQMIHSMEKLYRDMKKHAPDLPRMWHDRLRARLDEWKPDAIQNTRWEQELLLYVERADVTEELTRLQGHFSLCLDALASSGAVGRKLDFAVQELNREINTLGAKAADSQITPLVVDFKVLVEQFREQVQNIE